MAIDSTVQQDKIALVTGGTNGLGYETALRLAQSGAAVILVGRNADKGTAAVAAIQAQAPTAKVEFWAYDLALMRAVQALADRVQERQLRLNWLVQCAGVMLPRRTLTAEQLETVFAVQYLARFLLTQQLADTMTADGRILSVSAAGTIPIRLDFDNMMGEKWYNGIYALIHESVANDLFALKFIAATQNSTPRFFNYGPFFVHTGLFATMPLWFKLVLVTGGRLVATTPQDAANHMTALLTGDYPSGLYGRHLRRIRPSTYRTNVSIQERLWTYSEQVIAKVLSTT